MTLQIYYEDIEVGDEVTPLSKVATTAMLVQFAGASGDFNPIHYDASLAAARGLGKPIVHGALVRAWLGQMMTDWIGEEGILRKLACYHLKMNYPRQMKTTSEPEEGETWWCRGKVTKKYEESDNHYLECRVWVENGQGETTSPGSATALLPARGA